MALAKILNIGNAVVLLYAHYACPTCLLNLKWNQYDAAVTHHIAYFMCCWCGKLGAYRLQTSAEVPCCDIHLEDVEGKE